MLEMPSLSVVDFRRTPVPDPLLDVGRDPVQFSFEGERLTPELGGGGGGVGEGPLGLAAVVDFGGRGLRTRLRHINVSNPNLLRGKWPDPLRNDDYIRQSLVRL